MIKSKTSWLSVVMRIDRCLQFAESISSSSSPVNSAMLLVALSSFAAYTMDRRGVCFKKAQAPFFIVSRGLEGSDELAFFSKTEEPSMKYEASRL